MQRLATKEVVRPELLDERVNAILAQPSSRLPRTIQRLIAVIKAKMGSGSAVDPELKIVCEFRFVSELMFPLFLTIRHSYLGHPRDISSDTALSKALLTILWLFFF